MGAQSNHHASSSGRWFRGASQIPPSKIIIVVILILANLSILAYMVFLKGKGSADAQATSETRGEIQALPAIEITDDNGTKRVLTDLLGGVVAVAAVRDVPGGGAAAGPRQRLRRAAVGIFQANHVV